MSQMSQGKVAPKNCLVRLIGILVLMCSIEAGQAQAQGLANLLPWLDDQAATLPSQQAPLCNHPVTGEFIDETPGEQNCLNQCVARWQDNFLLSYYSCLENFDSFECDMILPELDIKGCCAECVPGSQPQPESQPEPQPQAPQGGVQIFVIPMGPGVPPLPEHLS